MYGSLSSGQERRDRLDAVLNRPPVLQQALRGYLAAYQQVDVPELPGVSESAQYGRHANPALAAVARPNQIALLGLVIQLFRVGIRHHVIDRIPRRSRCGGFPQSDRAASPRLGILWESRPVDRDVFGEEFGPALRRELRDRAHGDADAVRIDQFLVDPRLGLRVEALPAPPRAPTAAPGDTRRLWCICPRRRP